MRQEHLLHQPTSAEKARTDCANGNSENRRRRFIRLILDVDEHEGRLEGFGQPRERALDRRTEIEAREKIIGAVARRFASQRRQSLPGT